MARRKAMTVKQIAKLIKRGQPVPRRNPKSGPPVYFPDEPGEIPLEKIYAAVEAVIARRKAK